MNNSFRRSVPVALLLLSLSSAVWACNIPVFRYALERWKPDAYRAIVVHAEPLSEEQQSLVKTLQQQIDQGSLNLNVRLATLDEVNDQPYRHIIDEDLLMQGPVLVVQYPLQTELNSVVWHGRWTSESITQLTTSPARQEVVNRLVGGQSAVWVLVEGTDPVRTDAAATLLEQEIVHLKESLVLPQLTDNPEDSISGGPPLRIDFSVVRVQRDDPHEMALIQMLMSCEPDLMDLDDPVLFPVFGRCRAVLPLVGDGITSDNIRDSAKFVVGACSCQIKDLNPGFDLLVAADWQALMPWAKPITEPESDGSPGANKPPELVRIPAGSSRSNMNLVDENSAAATAAQGTSTRETLTEAELLESKSAAISGAVENSVTELAENGARKERLQRWNMIPIAAVTVILLSSISLYLRTRGHRKNREI
ncbi:MAG: hypothetical protein JNL58_13690 [Planctomyces sp.]|nr:hypothetical protein [Planctomyces sp.]